MTTPDYNHNAAPVNGQTSTTSSTANPVGNNSRSNYGSVFFTPLNPPNMKTFVYAPEVRVVVDSGGKQYDISKDIVGGSVVRRENSASSLEIRVANKKSRYNGKFGRMDRIACYMKRTDWVQVFTGYLDEVPFSQMYPGVVTLKATCTIKRLMHTWWNPALPASNALFDQSLLARGIDGVPVADSGLGKLLARILHEVGKWDAQDMLIQEFPMQFMTFLEQQYGQIESKNKEMVMNFRRMLLGDDTRGGVGKDVSRVYSSTGPSPNQMTLGAWGKGQPFYVKEIIAAVDARRMGPQTSDLVQSANQQTIGQAGSKDRESKEAWTATDTAGTQFQTYARESDAAILAVACALGESGMTMWASLGEPTSVNYANDGVQDGREGTSIGLFQQTSWKGSVADRMNARMSAGIFLDDLAKLQWRNMDPAVAIHTVQNNSTGTAPYAAHIEEAKLLVQGIREAQGYYAQAGVPGGTTLANAAGGAVEAASSASPIPIPGLSNDWKSSDATGAVGFAMAQVGKPYKWGGEGPDGFDCSGLMVAAFRSVGVELPYRRTQDMLNMPSVPMSAIQPGDMIVVNGGSHVVMWLGGGMIIEASGPENGVPIAPPHANTYNLADSHIIHVIDYKGNPIFNPTPIGPGTNLYTGQNPREGKVSEPIARNLFSYQFEPGMFASDTANMFTGEKSFIDAQPLIQVVSAICKAGMRNYQSAPTGEFCAYYPDWFGLDGKSAYLDLEDIECKDVRVVFSDDNLTTHVYVNGDFTFQGQSRGLMGWIESCGVVTVEDQWLYERLTAIAPSTTENLDPVSLVQRFGVRPYAQEYTLAGDHSLEFLIAAQLFMLKWAEQYRTTCQFTFMPELYPGMRINLKGHNLQVYVTEVTHTFDYENGFNTSAIIMAPSTGDASDRVMKGSNTSRMSPGGATPSFPSPVVMQ